MKRLLAFAIAVMMVFAMVPVSVSAAGTFTGDIGSGKTYATFGDAMAAFNSASYDKVVLNVYGVITLDEGIYFTTTKNVEINGMTDDAAITMVDSKHHVGQPSPYSNPYRPSNQPSGFCFPDAAYYDVEPGTTLTIRDLTVTNNKSGASELYPSGHEGGRARYLSYFYAENFIEENVDYIGGTVTSDNASFTNCTFTTDDSNEYCLFINSEYSGADEAYSLSFTGCEFAPASTAYGALKSANKNGTITLSVTECEFISVPNKAAINADPNTIITASDSAFVDCEKGWIKGDPGTTVNGTAIDSLSAEEVIALLEEAGCIDEPLPEPVVEEKGVNFFLFMFMKRLLTEYAVELVYDETMGIVEIDDEDGYVRFSKDAVITVAALEGYEVESVLVNGEAVELDEDGAYTIKRIRKDAKVEVTFAEIVEEEIEDAE